MSTPPPPTPGSASPPSPGSSPVCAPQNNVGNFDLSSVFHVQDDYLFSVTRPTDSNVNNAPEIVSYVNDLQKNLHTLSDKFKAANSSSQAVLAHQQEMLDIVHAEKKRLAEKKQLVDSADLQQQHVMVLNDTYRKQYMEYTKMIIVVVIGVAAYILIRMLGDFLQVPEWIVIILHILNIFLCLAIITYYYAVVQSRSKVNFDRLEIPPPNTAPGAAGPATADKKNKSLFGDFCFGESCCDSMNGVVWSDSLQMCVLKGAAPVSAPLAAPPAPTPAPAPSVAAAAKTTEQFATFSSAFFSDSSSSSSSSSMLPNPGGKLANSSAMPWQPAEVFIKI
jgi:hypothetical protein